MSVIAATSIAASAVVPATIVVRLMVLLRVIIVDPPFIPVTMSGEFRRGCLSAVGARDGVVSSHAPPAVVPHPTRLRNPSLAEL